MKEVLPGVFHWKTFHEGIQAYIHSCYLNASDPPVLIDPYIPRRGIEWFAVRGARWIGGAKVSPGKFLKETGP